jgi:DUF1365 family protein
MKSCLYIGAVMHQRHLPVPHGFSYRVFMMYLDLAELPTVLQRHWLWSARRPALAWFRRADYLGDARLPLDTAVRDLVAERTGARPAGPIRLLTHLRYFGHNFNPVSFYYVFDAADTRVETIVAEITNTPWKERHAYVLPVERADRLGPMRWSFDKRFHVSPFMPMQQQYEWRFGAPGRMLGVHMTSFDATLHLQRAPITSGNLARALLQFPAMTLRVLLGIYWQALRLKLKGVAVHEHPRVDASPPRASP